MGVTAASTVRTAWTQSLERLFAHYDFLILPTTQVFPFDIAEHWPRTVGGQAMATYHEWMKATCLVSMSGGPSLAVPAGFSAAGLPMGIQILAPVQREMDCLKLGAAYEKAADWTGRRLPPLLARA